MLRSLTAKFTQPIGVGIGLDMPWGIDHGFVYHAKEQRWDLPPPLRRFFAESKHDFAYSFCSIQPQAGGGLDSGSYLPGLRRFFEEAPHAGARVLHHTFLNLASDESYDRVPLYEFTNELTDALEVDWINEDVGIWSLQGKSLPYPLPPVLTKQGLDATIRNVKEANRQLTAPLLLEFPGFSYGLSFSCGHLHAYDFFYDLIDQTQNGLTLDTGHLIGYQWSLGKRGDELFSELDRLPLEHAFEVHLSGCGIHDDQFHDYHHGVLMDEQIQLLEILIEHCPKLRAITFEDPRFTNDGKLISQAQVNFERLRAIGAQWSGHS